MSKLKKEEFTRLSEYIPNLIEEGKTIREMAQILNVSRTTISRRCKSLGLHVPNYHNNLKFDNTVFDSIDTEEKAYWLGFLYADGNVHSTINSVSITLKAADKGHLEKFRDFLQAETSVKDTTVLVKGKIYQVCKFTVCDKHLKEQLIRLGCTPRKSLVLKFPELTTFVNQELVYDFIRGYVDGDGCLTFSRNGRLGLNIIGTREFLQGIYNAFPGMFTTIHKIKRVQTNVWSLTNCGEHADEVTYKLYSKATIYLDRKYERFAVLNRKV